MNIIILCDHIECEHNKEEWFVYYGQQHICTYHHPIFSWYKSERHCSSKHVKHLPKIINPCETCEDMFMDQCMNCCHLKPTKHD
jgi:hypothetical protein